MEKFDRKKHWEKIYRTKERKDVTWLQPTPETSLDFIKQFNIPETSKIIDIGGDESYLVDHLLQLGYQNITVPDISEAAIKRAIQRPGDNGKNVKWKVADEVTFKPTEDIILWHNHSMQFFNDLQKISKLNAKCIFRIWTRYKKHWMR